MFLETCEGLKASLQVEVHSVMNITWHWRDGSSYRFNSFLTKRDWVAMDVAKCSFDTASLNRGLPRLNSAAMADGPGHVCGTKGEPSIRICVLTWRGHHQVSLSKTGYAWMNTSPPFNHVEGGVQMLICASPLRPHPVTCQMMLMIKVKKKSGIDRSHQPPRLLRHESKN